jgi:hypothetical protein
MTYRTYLPIGPITSPWARQPDEAHDRADRPQQNKEIKEGQNAKYQAAVFCQDPETENNELNMKEDQANCRQ